MSTTSEMSVRGSVTQAGTPPAVDRAAVLAAIRRVVPAGHGVTPLHEPEFAGNEWRYLKECLDSGWVSSVGAFVDRFESMLCEITGVPFAVATVNGTAALQVCLRVVGVEPGDEVLVPALTFVATANAVSYLGAQPHFVDSEPVALGVDPDRLEAYLEDVAIVRQGQCWNRQSGAPIRALVPMHTFGHIGEIEALAQICGRWGIALVEDAAEALGSTRKGRHAGGFARVSALSFNGNKIVTSGGGGAVITNDPTIAARAKHLTTTARVGHRWSFVHDEVGYNFRLPNINAALGCAQLEQLPDFLRRKRLLAHRFAEAFRSVAGIGFLSEPEDCRSNYWLNAILLDHPDEHEREALLVDLNDNGLMARPAWTLMHRLPMYSSCPRMELSEAERLEQRIVNVPSSACLAG